MKAEEEVPRGRQADVKNWWIGEAIWPGQDSITWELSRD
jgi:hypothetical protein